MSSFEGTMFLYKDAVLDNFEEKNRMKSIYFLSHFHADHMTGLKTESFKNCLTANNAKICMSKITQSLLLNRKEYSHLDKLIQVLDVNVAHRIKLRKENPYYVTVTLLPAGHCPGSVMFLFEGEQGNILYTGDFRLARQDIESMNALFVNGRPKDLKAIHCDTTFLVEKAKYLPTRQLLTSHILELIRGWLDSSKKHQIVLKHKATLGYEQIYVDIYNNLNEKVHVNSSNYKVYQTIDDIARSTTPTMNESIRVHCRCWTKEQSTNSCLPCEASAAPDDILFISLSALGFVQGLRNEDVLIKVGENSYKGLYSFHSSYMEICDLIRILKPDRVFPNVIPNGQSAEEVQERLNALVSNYQKEKEEREIELLNEAKKKTSIFRAEMTNHSHEFDFFHSLNDEQTQNKAENRTQKVKDSRGVKYNEKTGMFSFGFACETLSEKEPSQSTNASLNEDTKSTEGAEEEMEQTLQDETQKGITNTKELKSILEKTDHLTNYTNKPKSNSVFNEEERSAAADDKDDEAKSSESKKRKLNDGTGVADERSLNESNVSQSSKVIENTSNPLKRKPVENKDIPIIYISSDSEPTQPNPPRHYEIALLASQPMEPDMTRMTQGGWLINYARGEQEIVYLSDDTDTEEGEILYEEQVNFLIKKVNCFNPFVLSIKLRKRKQNMRERWARRWEEKIKNPNIAQEDLEAMEKRYKMLDNCHLNSSQKIIDRDCNDSVELGKTVTKMDLNSQEYEGDLDTTNESYISNNFKNRIKRLTKKRNSPSAHDVVDLTVD
ncbi:DgyrCDS1971 [Dimorphilus gyrociliatus]|uniref:Protein artemis n=1 Tax=Dimorphilus gyrociliatus TaxID=2664684 RepID=A0A7I8V936_9ANNE|nr:DgyrCDS1971 [Dimorphilus gyrociliatus]